MTTDDRPPIEDVIKDMGDDALAETALSMRVEGNRLVRMAGMAEHELRQRMIDREATVLDTEHWTGKLSPGAPSHEYDDAKMEAVLPLLSEEEQAKVRVQPPAPPPRWDKRFLNELTKRGGIIRAAIENATTMTRGAPRLSLERKETDDGGE